MVMDDDHESAEHSLPHSEALVGQVDLLVPAEEPGSSSSLSPSSTCSSLSASFFRVDESKFYVDDKIIASLSISGELPSKERTDEAFPNTSESLPSLSGWEHNNTATREQSEHDPNESQPNSAKFCQESSGSPQSPNEVDSDDETNLGSPGSVSTPTSMQNESVLQSPPVQVMERPEISSTYRIPSHVFERSKSVNQAEWSVASNESLFSIQVGNASFSRDAGFQVGKSGELFSPHNLKDRVYSKSPLATIPAVDSENRGSGFEEDSSLLYAAAVETTKDVNEDRNKARDQSEEGNFNFSNHKSVGSGAGACSSAFPIKKRKKRKKGCAWLCCCFKCCRPCCDCAWPSCSCPKCSPGCCDFKCPKCSPSCCNFTRPSCFTPKLGSTCCSGSQSTSTCFNCGWPACSCSKCSPRGSHCSCSSCCEPCSCAWPSCSSCCAWPSCSSCCAWPSCSSRCAWPSCSSRCAWPSCSSRCAWPSCSSCSSCCAWPSCFSCCRTCGHCKWPSCSCCCPCSSCKWSMCPCSSCSLMCCKWPWTSCCRSNRCRSCQFKSPPCCLPNCGGCCCHSTGVSCYRCNCSCKVSICKV